MTTAAEVSLPITLNPEIVFCPSPTGEYVVAKNQRTSEYFRLSVDEHFLLNELASGRDVDAICQEYESRFESELEADDVADFIGLADKRGLTGTGGKSDKADSDETPAKSRRRSRSLGATLIYSRISLWNPDACFTRVAPRLSFIWTRTFVFACLALMVISSVLAITNLTELVQSVQSAISLRSMIVVWGTIILVTMLHECAHGLTCKHFGGKVTEIGLLFLFFTPCMFCNISDAWLFPKRSHRLYATLAGIFLDLTLWAVAVLGWRCLLPGTFPYQLCVIIISVCGTRSLLNLNPFMKLDGYYLLVDILDAPNLRRNSWDMWSGTLRRVLCGTGGPQVSGNGWVMLYGAVSWTMAMVAVSFGVFKGTGYAAQALGIFGAGGVMYISSYIYRRLFRGFVANEGGSESSGFALPVTFRTMAIAGALGVAAIIPIKDRSTGSFEVRPMHHADVPSPVTGFIRQMHVQEGQKVAAGQLLADIEIPEIASQIRQKEAELSEATANLRRLEAGTRIEVLREQREKVSRARLWRDSAETDLNRSKIALNEELLKLEKQIDQSKSEMEYVRENYAHAQRLYERGAFAGHQLRNEKKKLDIATLQLDQAKAAHRQRQTAGLIEEERELERRNKDLADAESALSVLEAGSRPEELDAERARVTRLNEELKQLVHTQSKQKLVAPRNGVVVTPRLNEKVGVFIKCGDTLFNIDDTETVDVEVTVDEQNIVGVGHGQVVELVARAMPFNRFYGKVTRVAPKASTEKGQPMGKVVVYCQLTESDARLLSGMSGYARILRDRRPLGWLATSRLVKFMRTELWF